MSRLDLAVTAFVWGHANRFRRLDSAVNMKKSAGTIDYTGPAPEEPRDRLLEADREYEARSGRSGFLYAYEPGDGRGKRYVFADGTVKTSRAAAVRYVEELLRCLQK